MTSGAWMCGQQDDELNVWFAPRQHDKPFADPERVQKWRLSLAALLFLTVLLSDRLWFCAEAKRTQTRDRFAWTDPGENASAARHAALAGIFTARSCRSDSLSKSCFTFEDAELVCRAQSEPAGTRSSPDFNLSDLYMSFCNTYSLLDLFYGSLSPDSLNCSLDAAMGGDVLACTSCVQAFQRYDQHAQEKYEEFEALIEKYETDVYSVRTCMEECKMAYKPWLCSQYFQTTQMHCSNKIPCRQYCVEVLKRCPFILPDNDDLIHGGSPSFICSGLLENPSSMETECCDVRWDFTLDSRSDGTIKRTHPSCHHRMSVATSGTSRLCNSRFRLCLLVLVLLHTVATVTAAQNSTGISLGGIASVEDSSTSEE
ncbi:transmembrane protein FAM155A-like [Arapaima gigas]